MFSSHRKCCARFVEKRLQQIELEEMEEEEPSPTFSLFSPKPRQAQVTLFGFCWLADWLTGSYSQDTNKGGGKPSSCLLRLLDMIAKEKQRVSSALLENVRAGMMQVVELRNFTLYEVIRVSS